MKIPIDFKKSVTILTALLAIFCFKNLNAQKITRDDSNNTNTDFVCPNENIGYTLDVSNTKFTNCLIKWTATNGTISGRDDGSTVTVSWKDVPGNTAQLKCTLSGCTDADGHSISGKEVTFTDQLVLSVNGQNFDAFPNSVTLDYCGTKQVTINVPHMYVQGTGGIAQPPLQEVIYDWTLPAGWATSGSTFTTVPTIVIYPTGCAVPGTVQVKGTINDRCGSAAESNGASISLNGAQPFVTVGIPLGYTGSTACNKTPVTFKANLSPSLGCVSSYNWSYPSGWTIFSQSGNTIILTPSGSPADSDPTHPIKVVVNFTCGTSISSAGYNPPYTPPVISGPSTICTNAQYTILNAPSVSFTWSSNYPTGVSVVGSNPPISNPSKADATLNNGFVGTVKLSAVSSCGIATAPINVHGGKPYFTSVKYNGTSADFSGSTAYSFPLSSWNTVWVSASTTGSNQSGHLNFSVTSNAYAVNTSTLNDSTFTFLTKFNNNQFDVNFFAENPCGKTYGSIYFCNINCPQIVAPVKHGRPSLTVFPNPASSNLTVQLSDSLSNGSNLNQVYQLSLFNRYAQTVYSVESNTKSMQIPVDNIPADIYYLNVIYNGVVLREQIVIGR